METVLLVVVAAAVVLLTSLFKVIDFQTKTKQLIALGTSVVAGAVTAYATGQFNDVSDVAAIATVVYGLAQGIYQFLFDEGRVLSFVDSFLENIRPGDGGEPE
jgi:hypothetical protein